MTFAKQADIYLARIATRRRNPAKAASVKAFGSRIRAALPAIGTMRLDDIHSGTLKHLAAILTEEKYSSNSIQSILTVVKQVIASDVDERTGDSKHPCRWNAEFIDAPEATSKEISVPTAEEIQSALASTRAPLWQFMATQAATGMRKGELAALCISDFDPVGMLHVSRTLSQHGETSAKTRAGIRTVDIHPDVTAMLVAMLDGRTTGRLFDVSLGAVRWAYDILNLKTHSFRHFRYTHLQKCKVSPAIQNYWIGHAAKGMSAIYGHIEQDVDLRQHLVREVGLGFNLPTIAAFEAQAVAVSA